MTRSFVLLPALLLAACSVGEYGETQMMGGDTMMNTEDKNLCVNKGTPGTAYNHTTMPTGPRAGMGCIAVGCHLTGNTGAGATAFAFAGTVYKDTNGTTPQPGVTVRIFAAGGKRSLAKAVSDSAGNFIIRGDFSAFPYETDVTGCGMDSVAQGIRPMLSPIARTDANCNAGGTCHQAAPQKTATPVYLMD